MAALLPRLRCISSRTLALAVAAGAGSTAVVLAESSRASPSSSEPSAADGPRPSSDFSVLDLSRYNLTHHLLHESLAGDEKLERYELSLSSDRKALQAAVRLGRKACGHPQYIHGGAIASVFDDAMGTLFLSAGQGSGFTANLNVDYRAPVPAGAELRIICSVDKTEVSARSGARKVWLSARMESAEGSPPRLFAQARALFIVKDTSVGVAAYGFLDRALGAMRDWLWPIPSAQKEKKHVAAQPGSMA